MEATGRTGPRYRQIADDLRARIAAGEFAEGERIPSRSQLHARYGAAINTVERAIEELRREGRLETAHGSGTFVRRPPEPERAPDLTEVMKRLEAAEATAERVGAVETDLMDLRGQLGMPSSGQRRRGSSSRKDRHERAG